MEMKKLLHTGLAMLCIASMIIGYFGGLAPETKVEAAETVETLPTTGFTEVTPKDFGIEDFSGSEKTTHVSSLDPVTSMNQKVMFSSNIVFGADSTFYYCSPNAVQGAAGQTFGIGFKMYSNGRVRFYNYIGSQNFYVGGEFVESESGPTYQGGTFTGSTGTNTKRYFDYTHDSTLVTKNVAFSVTTEIVDFDLDEDDDDLKIGLWFDGVLQDNKYFYILNVDAVIEPYLSMTVQSSSSPFATVPATAQDGYRVVTPATFGIADQQSETDGGINVSTPASDIIPYMVDKTIFKAKLRNATSESTTGTNGVSEISYLDGNIEINVSPKASSGLLIYNQKATGKNEMYASYTKMEDGVDNSATYTQIAKGSSTTYLGASSSYGKFAFNTGNEYMLSVITEFVDFDNDTYKDDLQIQISIYAKETNFVPKYCYFVDYEETTFDGTMTTSNMKAIVSPNIEPDDLGLVGGEYAEADNVVATSTIAISKVMDGTTLETDVIFNGVGASILYGCDAEDNAKAIKLTSTTEGIQVSHTYGDAEENIVLLDKSKVGIDVLNNKFHLKLTTDALDSDGDTEVDDVKLGIQVNSKTSTFLILNVAPQLTSANTARLGVECEGDASVIIGRIASNTVDEAYHCLDDGAYTKDSADGISRLSVNGAVVTDGNFTLDTLGTHRVVVTENRQVLRENVTLYKRYDVDESKTVDVIDLVRMLKVADDSTEATRLSRAGQLAISYESADAWSNDIAVPVLEFMRRALIGAEAPQKKTDEITLINKEQLKKFANEYGAFMNSFTFKADLSSDSIERLNQIWILSTNAKYISMNGEYPTIQYKITTPSGRQLYISQPYKVGEKDKYVVREWRVPETLDNYTTLHVSFVIPDGVALYINDISAKDNVEGELSAMDDTVYSADNGVKYLAHSGFIGYAPDNTILGFEMAGKMGFTSLITIPKFTSDGVGVCFHDDYLYERLLYDNGTELPEDETIGIEDYTYEELKEFDAGLRKGEAFSCDVPTLEEYFYYCDKYQMAPIFSVHPELTETQWEYVKRLLLDQTKGYKQGSQQVLLGEEMVPSTWIYDHFQIKAGSTSGFDVPFGVFGFEIGGYINIQATTFGTDDFTYVLRNVKKAAAEQGINFFDKVGAEIFVNDPALEEKIAYYRSYGFTRISLAPTYGLSGGFSGEQLRYYMDLGVNSFTVDYHGSMGLNW